MFKCRSEYNHKYRKKKRDHINCTNKALKLLYGAFILGKITNMFYSNKYIYLLYNTIRIT